MQQLGNNTNSSLNGGLQSKMSTNKKEDTSYLIKNPIEEEIDQEFNNIADKNGIRDKSYSN